MKIEKKITVVLVAAMLAATAGCSSLPKKFIRKKKEPKHTPSAIYLQDGAYEKKYSNSYYYKSHYTYWKGWHDELIGEIGGNQKRVTRSAQESFNHLTEMARYLSPERKQALDPILADLGRITQRLESGNVSSSEEGGLRVDLEKIRRLVSNDFYYNKVKDQLIPDAVEL